MSSPETHIKIGTQHYELDTDYISWPYGDSTKKKNELEKLKLLPKLSGISFSGSDLDDAGLKILSTIHQLEQLDLQQTQITNDGLSYLKNMGRLSYLRLKENDQLTNSCILHLKQLKYLEELQLQETGLNQEGLDRLAGKQSLTRIVLSLDKGNYNYESLLELSAKLPGCHILVKGHGEFFKGRFEGSWKENH